MEQKLHKAPFNGTNNRKHTRGRIKMMQKTQSIPIWKRRLFGGKIVFLGFKYIQH